MKIKVLFALLCSIVMMWNIPVLAYDMTEEELYEYRRPQYTPETNVTIRDGEITFYIQRNFYMMNYSVVPELSIMLKESEKGILQDGDIIYFETSREDDKYFTNSDLRIESKGVSVEEVLSEREQNHFAIRISRNDEKENAFIRINFDANLKGFSNDDAENLPVFSLCLNTDNTKTNNLFAKEYKQNILLSYNFLKVLNEEMSLKLMKEDRQRELEVQFPDMVFLVDDKNMQWNNDIKQLKQAVYINENGTAMICFDDFIDIAKQLENIGVKVLQKNNMYFITAGENDIVINVESGDVNIQEKVLKNILEQKDGAYYISLREFANLFGMGERIYWHRWDKTIHIK